MSFALPNLEDLGSILELNVPQGNPGMVLSYDSNSVAGPQGGNQVNQTILQNNVHNSSSWSVSTNQNAVIQSTNKNQRIRSRRRADAQPAQANILQPGLNNLLPFSALLPNFPDGANPMGGLDASIPQEMATNEETQNPGPADPQEERRGRKNERERRRRAEVNECFDILASVLKVNRKNKADKTSVLQTAINVIRAYEAQLMQFTTSEAHNSSQATNAAMEMENMRKELAATKAELNSKDAALKQANAEIAQLRAQLKEANTTATATAAATTTPATAVPVLPTVPKPETHSLAAALENITQMAHNTSETEHTQVIDTSVLPPIKEEAGRKSPSHSPHRMDDHDDMSVPPTKRLHRVSPRSSTHRYAPASTPQMFNTSPSIGTLTDHFKDVDINANGTAKHRVDSLHPLSKSGFLPDLEVADPTPAYAEPMIIKDLDEASQGGMGASSTRANSNTSTSANSNPFNLSFNVGLPIEEAVSDPELFPQKYPSFSNLQIPEFFTF